MREAPSTGLGTKQEQVIEKCSMSSFPSPASILPLSSKVGVALRGGQGRGTSPPNPQQKCTHVRPCTQMCTVHTHTGLCVVTHLLAPSHLQLHGHHLAHGQGFLSGSRLSGGF